MPSPEPTETCGCGDELKRRAAALDTEVNVSVWRRGMKMPAGFDEFGMSCPHGVRWHMEPTTDQRLHWNETKTP